MIFYLIILQLILTNFDITVDLNKSGTEHDLRTSQLIIREIISGENNINSRPKKNETF